MSHYHLEIIMPPTDDVEAAVKRILAPFDENERDNEEARGHPFWDYWLIGGRWSGSKMLSIIGENREAKFRKALHEAHITVSGLQFGKPTLQPASQIETVNRMWNAMFPDAPIKVCPLFDNYKGDDGDVMPLSGVPRDMKCSHLIVAGPDYKEEGPEAVFMIRDDMWNGVNYVSSTWDGTIGGGLLMASKQLANFNPEYAAKRTPADDWLAVTVDYHS